MLDLDSALAPIAKQNATSLTTEAFAPESRNIMIVDDSHSQLAMLGIILKKHGYTVHKASSGAQALTILETTDVPVIISDWMMPEMSGPELCAQVRKQQKDNYTYFILATVKSDMDDLVSGFDAGADDYISKPIEQRALLARLKAAFRLVKLQRDLSANRLALAKTHAELVSIHNETEKDLVAASELIASLIPEANGQCNGANIATMFQPSTHMGGDLVGYFPLNDEEIAAYVIDVSGHGVGAALLSTIVSQSLSATPGVTNCAFEETAEHTFQHCSPERVVAKLNDRHLSALASDQYFTIAYAIINRNTGEGQLCLGGHPPAIILRKSGETELVGDGGPPVALLDGVTYESVPFRLNNGDKLFLYSDGIIEEPLLEGGMLGEEGLMAIVGELANSPMERFTIELLDTLRLLTGKSVFHDDISCLLFDCP